MRSPIRLSGDGPALLPAPAHGEHTRQVLLDCGFTEAEVEAFLAAESFGNHLETLSIGKYFLRDRDRQRVR